jgi:hypoxanthine phosphoribosyltransferase
MDIKKEYLGWNDIETLTTNVIESLITSGWIPTVVVGLTRGGLTPAAMISHYLKVPMCSLDVSLRDNDGPFGSATSTWIPEEIANGHRILVVDDINDSGATFAWIRDDWSKTVQFIKSDGPDWPWSNIKFASLLHNEPSPQPSDFHGRLINKIHDPVWIVFPWESWYQKNI